MNAISKISALLLVMLLPAFVLAAPPKSAKGDPKSREFNEQGASAMVAKDFARAEDLFKQALAADSGNITAAYNLAAAYLILKKELEAVSLLEDYTGKYQGDPGMFVRLGDAYFAAKKVEKALGAYERAYKLAPKYEGLAAKLGGVYALANRLPDAEKMYLKAVEQSPKDVQLLSNLSSVFLANGKAEQAIGTARRGLQVKPTSELYVTMGSAYENMKDFKSSLISYERAQDLGDKRPEVREKILELKKLVS